MSCPLPLSFPPFFFLSSQENHLPSPFLRVRPPLGSNTPLRNFDLHRNSPPRLPSKEHEHPTPPSCPCNPLDGQVTVGLVSSQQEGRPWGRRKGMERGGRVGGRVSFLLGSRHTGDSLSLSLFSESGEVWAARRRRRRKVARGANNPRDSTNKTATGLRLFED